MTYILFFSISTLLFYLSQKKVEINSQIKKKNTFFFAFIGILCLSLLAGLRYESIGTDVRTYVIYTFERVSTRGSFFEVVNRSFLEPGYEILCYFSSCISSDIHVLHFITAFIIILFIYLWGKDYKETNTIAFTMLIFDLFYFSSSLNIVRQFLAIAIVLYSTKYLFLDKKIKYCIFLLLAISFHTSAIICVLFIPIFAFLKANQSSKMKTFIIIAFVGVGLVMLQPIVVNLAGLGIIPHKYVNYFSSGGNSSAIMQFIIRLPFIILGYIFYDDVIKINSKNKYTYSFLIIDMVLAMLAPVIGDASRIALYFGIWQCVYLPDLCAAIEKKYKKNVLIKISFVSYFVVYWVYTIVIRNFSETYPYISDVFTWL